ncbi:MAG: phosphatase PAP2 family protein [Alphaproteobacteria bacterium]|nr:phosphatase PAP2 family protein [Alphaproteobacteria bacterium]
MSFRSGVLTDLFKIFPFFASDAFYILLISVGYWRHTQDRLFWDLGFLVPFTTLLSCTLKNLFLIPRPPEIFHLVPVHDPFGFPSGDVYVATAFWGMLCLTINSKRLWIIAGALLLMMMISRLYLGVHNVSDIVGGFILGGFTLWCYRSRFFQTFSSQWFSGRMATYGAVVSFCALVYFIVSFSLPVPAMVIMALGALGGYGISLSFRAHGFLLPMKVQPLSVPSIIFFLSILGGFVWFFPGAREGSMLLMWVLGLIKYAFVVALIYIILPLSHQWLSPQFGRKKYKKNGS